MINVDRRLRWHNQQVVQPQPARFHLPPLLTVTVLMIVGFFVAATSLLLIARSAAPSDNPFTAYADVLPGQPRVNVQAHGFKCRVFDTYEHFVEACLLEPESGFFSHVIAGSSGDALDTLTFTVRENALTLGDVAVAFGVQPRRESAPNSWTVEEFTVSFWLEPDEFSYFQPIQYLYLLRARADRTNNSKRLRWFGKHKCNCRFQGHLRTSRPICS